MPRSITFSQTPNPLALKCVLSMPLEAHGGSGAIRSYSTPAAAHADPAATAVLSVPGVRAVLIADNGLWVTVTRAESASWKSLRPALDSCLRTLP